MSDMDPASAGGAPGGHEVHKQGWLRRLPPQERKLISPFSRPPKCEKLWVIFCVHEAQEPWLEFYENRRSAFSHRPTSRLSLLRCLHVSPSIRFQQDNEHVLAVTLEGEHVRLALQTRELMIEWMDTLRTKLRELGVLTPRDNLYSKEPEGSLRSPMLRNPNSPLPPTPAPAFLFPPPSGMEFREEVSSSSRHGGSPAPSLTLSTMSCPPGGVSGPPTASHAPSDPTFAATPSVVSYVRHHDSGTRRSSSFRTSLPSSPSSSLPVSFVRCPQGPQASPREHVTVLTVPPPSDVFSFDDVSAVLESSGGVASSQLYDEDPPGGVGNSLSAGGFSYGGPPFGGSSFGGPTSMGSGYGGPTSGGSGFGGPPCSGSSKPPIVPQRRDVVSSPPGGGTSQWCTDVGVQDPQYNGGGYEPLFLAFSETAAPPPTPTSPTSPTPTPQAPNTGLLRRRSEQRRSGRREQARRAASVGPSIAPRQPFPVSPAGHVMSLREQQVVRLSKEIAHAAGVRLTLRRKDCVNSIAFVNCFSQVYVAGWKQREHPYLHNTFHLGDRLISIGGAPVASAAEAQSLIRSDSAVLVEVVVRRAPHGKVFALKREEEGQPLGIVREGNTAEIREVVAGGLAAAEGLPPRAPTVDGGGQTSWVLTEVNHRPLNLFFKHQEIQDRLNCVGRDISILVQPLDLVRAMKKQLKALRGYKDYIVM